MNNQHKHKKQHTAAQYETLLDKVLADFQEHADPLDKKTSDEMDRRFEQVLALIRSEQSSTETPAETLAKKDVRAGTQRFDFALAASDSQSIVPRESTSLFPALCDPILVDGAYREFLTDCAKVFVTLHGGEVFTHLMLDEVPVALEILADGKTALLVGYGRVKFLNFVERMEREPEQHSMRWGAVGQGRGI